MRKKKIKIEEQGAISALWQKITQPVKDAIYALQVKIHQRLHKNKKPMSGQRKKVGEAIFYWAMLAFPLFQFAVMYIYVNINSILMAFQSYTVNLDGSSTVDWVWFQNFSDFFKMLAHDQLMGRRFRNSLIVYGFGILFGTSLGILFSYYIYKKYPGAGAFRVLLMCPSIISGVVFVLLFKYIADRFLPQVFGITSLLNQNGFKLLFTIILFNTFIGFGSSVLMYSNAMSRIPESLVEYAQLEGCTPLKEFFSITLPLAYPTIETFLIIGIANIFINDANLYTFYMKDESSCEQITNVGYYLYNIIRHTPNRAAYNLAATVGVCLTIVTIPTVMIARWLLDKLDKGAEF